MSGAVVQEVSVVSVDGRRIVWWVGVFACLGGREGEGLWGRMRWFGEIIACG